MLATPPFIIILNKRRCGANSDPSCYPDFPDLVLFGGGVFKLLAVASAFVMKKCFSTGISMGCIMVKLLAAAAPGEKCHPAVQEPVARPLNI